MKKEYLGTFFALMTAVISGFSIVANKFFVIGIDPTVFTAIRAIIIGFAFLLISFFTGSFDKHTFTKNRFVYLLFIGLIGGGIAFLLFFTGLKMTTAGSAAFLHKTLPLYAFFLAFVFLREKITKKHISSMLAMLFGTFLILYSHINFEMMIGDALVIGATVLWAIENVMAKKVMIKGEKNWTVSFSRMFFGSIFLFGIAVLTGSIEAVFALTIEQFLYIIASTAILFCYIGCWYYSIRMINLSKASSLLLVAPVISLVLGYFLLDESIHLIQLAGSILILAGAYFVSGIKSEFISE